jgi:hypothetical protein
MPAETHAHALISVSPDMGGAYTLIMPPDEYQQEEFRVTDSNEGPRPPQSRRDSGDGYDTPVLGWGVDTPLAKFVERKGGPLFVVCHCI